ncbi:MAG: hypothetical protein K0S26_3043, partial [Bacteroidota bacterium]|nr:hypothetical protein [Bacteroidota bacterium]
TLADNSISEYGTWTFDNDFSYSYTRSDITPSKKIKTFQFDPIKCEIILDVKRNLFADLTNLEIIYLDSKYLFYKCNDNPRGDHTKLLRRK